MDTVAANFNMYKPVNFTHWDKPVASEEKKWPDDTNKWVDTVSVDDSWSQVENTGMKAELHTTEDVHTETASSPSSSLDSKSCNDDGVSYQDEKLNHDESNSNDGGNDQENVAVIDKEAEDAKSKILKVDIPTSNYSDHPQYSESSTCIEMGAKFHSFADFEKVFKKWMNDNYHPFRVASSEQMRLPNNTQDETFRYRYIVYHCVHYGTPRMRGNGKRPNQSYLPSGCKAMLRLNFNYSDNALRITTLQTEHQNHEIGPEHFGAKRPKFSPYPDKVKSKSPDSQQSGKSSVKASPVPISTWSPTNTAVSENNTTNTEIVNNTPSVLQLLSPFINSQTIQQTPNVFQTLAVPQSTQPTATQDVSLPSLSKLFADAYSNVLLSTQQQMFGLIFRQQQEEKMLALQEEYRRLLTVLTSINFNKLDLLDKVVIQLKCVIEFIKQNSI